MYHPLKASDDGYTNLFMFTQLLIKTSVINRVKVGGGGSDARSLEVRLFCSTCLLTFFASNFFLPELESSEKKFWERNPARKKGSQARVDHPTPTSDRSMNELSWTQS
jgi:hypothetical protein